MRKKRILDMMKQQPNDAFLHFALAKEFEKESDWEKAISYYEWIRKNEPTYVGMYYHLGAAAIEHELDSEYIDEIYQAGMEMAKSQSDQHALSELQNAYMNWQMEL